MTGRPERDLAGTAAAPGLAIGVLLPLGDRRGPADRAAGTPAGERVALEDAVAASAEALHGLAARADPLAAEILSVQLALLQDPELLAPARERLAAGASAAAAWEAAIGPLIADYAAEPDAYFRARAADLKDLRERVLRTLASDDTPPDPAAGEAIVVADELAPSRFLELGRSRVRGVALAGGSAAGHTAMLARARGVPLVTGLGGALTALEPGARAILDADAGRLLVAPDADTEADYRRRIAARAAEVDTAADFAMRPAATADGTPVAVLLNVDDPRQLDGLDPACCDGIGLTRTEFLFRDTGLPDEARQYGAYRRIVDWAAGRPATIRSLDAGGDKPVPGLTPQGESNPFLGLRGLRLSLARPEVFRVQLRALARAAAHGEVKVLLPMVTLPREFAAARDLMGQALAELRAAGVRAGRPQLGMMVETPAAALAAGEFDADFYSLGTNDLVQYVTASARDIQAVAHLQEPLIAPVLELIGRVAQAGAARGAEVSLCGEMAARPECVPALLESGVRALSVPPAKVGAVKKAIAAHRIGAGDTPVEGSMEGAGDTVGRRGEGKP